MHYSCDSNLAFASLSHIIRDVSGGWLLRSVHANGASFFFLALYAHIGRGIYYGRYTYKGTWNIGVLLLLLVIATAFLGYVLPWGQMRYWGATVITRILSAVPYMGTALTTWIWGGFSVDNATLTRFYTIHFLLPFLISGVTVLHIFYLHGTGSNNPLGVLSDTDKVPFHWYYRVKDIFGFAVLIRALSVLVLLFPLALSEADNFIPANPILTPPHIVPEWYFLFAYAILRSVPSKFGGVIALVCSILVLLRLPHSHNQKIKGLSYYGPVKALFWTHVVVIIILTAAGAWPVTDPYVSFSQVLSIVYFSFYLSLPGARAIWDSALA